MNAPSKHSQPHYHGKALSCQSCSCTSTTLKASSHQACTALSSPPATNTGPQTRWCCLCAAQDEAWHVLHAMYSLDEANKQASNVPGARFSSTSACQKICPSGCDTLSTFTDMPKSTDTTADVAPSMTTGLRIGMAWSHPGPSVTFESSRTSNGCRVATEASCRSFGMRVVLSTLRTLQPG